MSDLVTWLRARLDEDERDIRGSRGLTPGELHWSMPDWLDEDRLLAEVEAKRRILDWYDAAWAAVKNHPDDMGNKGWGLAMIKVVKLLALPYATRDGYREEWRP